LVVGLLMAAIAGVAWWAWDRRAPSDADAVAAIETIRAGDLVITLSNATGTLTQGSNRFRIEFRSAETNDLVDVGTVQFGGTMSMPGMVMTSPTTTTPTGQPGVYEVMGEYGMAGSWQITLEWGGPAGRGSATFVGDVQ
jgi:hypothetical protein